MTAPPTPFGQFLSNVIRMFVLMISWYSFNKGHVESPKHCIHVSFKRIQQLAPEID